MQYCDFCHNYGLCYLAQSPDNVIFVMDATIGQACESQVNNILVDLCFVRGTGQHTTLMVHTYSVTICILALLYHEYWFTVVHESVIFTQQCHFTCMFLLGQSIQRQSRCCFTLCWKERSAVCSARSFYPRLL